MFDHEHTDPAPRQRIMGRARSIRSCRAGGGLVEQEHRRLGHKRACRRARDTVRQRRRPFVRLPSSAPRRPPAWRGQPASGADRVGGKATATGRRTTSRLSTPSSPRTARRLPRSHVPARAPPSTDQPSMHRRQTDRSADGVVKPVTTSDRRLSAPFGRSNRRPRRASRNTPSTATPPNVTTGR